MDDGLRESQDERLLHRLIFFTDAVMAIVMTLLVLELRPPTPGLGQAATLAELSGHLLAFATSFALGGVFWLAHMSTMRRLQHFDWAVAIANLLFLFPVSLMPFTSAWVGRDGFTDGMAWATYCAVLIAVSAGNVILVLVATRGGGRLMNGITLRERAYRVARASSPGVAFSVGLWLVFTGHGILTLYCWVLIAPIMLLARAFLGPRKAA
jgi:uncharacterized membrane protein